MLKQLFIAVLVLFLSGCAGTENRPRIADADVWPEYSETMKPWTRWWWMGSAVDKENITRRLEEFAEAGIGGMEITPIYGVKGFEDQFIQHISPQWMDMLVYTLDEADRLGLGVDMVLGTGWPFGGPQVKPEFAAKQLACRTYTLSAGQELNDPISPLPGRNSDNMQLHSLSAFTEAGEKEDLSNRLQGQKLDWIPEKNCTLYAIFLGPTGQQVKRAAPGGEGSVLDHLSLEGLRQYLLPYETALSPVKGRLRALFNDSYEVYGANTTSLIFEEFQKLRGYDLSDYLPQLFGTEDLSDGLRVLSDYRETLSDLLTDDFSKEWVRWSSDFGFLTKYQAHGCPANLLDIYAAADIPECETFYGTQFDIPGVRWDSSDANRAQPDLIMLKFASSAAHISGKELTSSESLTWLREHFKTALSQCKPEVEQLFLSGVNHAFFHGSTYSPDKAPWPGWKFYASVNFVATSTLWNDAPSFYEYITRCQSMLQSGKSDNEILVYWPYYDVIGEEHERSLLLQLAIDDIDHWLVPTNFYRLVRKLLDQGYGVDFVSDRYLKSASVEDQKISVGGNKYEALLVPECTHMPVETLQLLLNISDEGAQILSEALPVTVPGYFEYMEREQQLKSLLRAGKADLQTGPDLIAELRKLGIDGESIAETGMDFVRRDLGDGKMYYLVNHSARHIDGFIPLNYKSQAIMIMDPLNGEYGLGNVRSKKGKSEVYLQLSPGESLILRTHDKPVQAKNWEYFHSLGDPVHLQGSWNLEFLDGGPRIPDAATMNELTSWTALSSHAEAFSGTARYKLQFDHPDPGITDWKLDLGDVRESARVWINGEYLGCLWSVPFSTMVDQLTEGQNILEVEVTNLSANRLRDLEISGEEWKIFYEINMVNRHYEPFDATLWEPMPSGLLGQVTLTPMQKL